MNLERAQRLFPLTVALLTLIVFLPALRNDFVNWDDARNFLTNNDYRGLGVHQLKWMWTSHLLGRYVPLSWMTLGLDYTIWGMDPVGYHLTNLLWHTANAVLMYFLALELLRVAMSQNRSVSLGAFFAALFFAIHPLRAESVAWVTERRDLVSGLFYLVAVLLYVRGCRSGQRIPGKYYWGCFASFLAAILSKEMVVTLPVVLLILDVYPFRRIGVQALIEKIPFLIVSIADSGFAVYIGRQEGLTSSLAHVNVFSRLAISTYGLAFYVWKTLVPFHLSPFYALTSHRVDPRGLPFLGSAMVVMGITATASFLRRRLPGLPTVWATYAVTLLPVLGIFQNGLQITADRYSYLACIGWGLIAGACLIHVQPAIATSAAAVALAVLSCLTWQQVQIWQDSETLWRHALKIEQSAVAWNNLGLALAERGDTLAAIEQYKHSLRMDPDFEYAHNNLGHALLEIQDWDDARREFEAALKVKQDLPDAHNGLGIALMMQNRLNEAIAQFQIALQLYPTYDDARANLARALALKKEQVHP